MFSLIIIISNVGKLQKNDDNLSDLCMKKNFESQKYVMPLEKKSNALNGAP